MHEDLKAELDAARGSMDEIWQYFAYPSALRASYELARIIGRDMDMKELGAYYYGSDILLPVESLGSMIYVPAPLLEIDREHKEECPFNGIALLSPDYKNILYVGTAEKSDWSNARILDGLAPDKARMTATDPTYRVRILRLMNRMLDLRRDTYEQMRLNNTQYVPHLHDLALRLTDAYADEMREVR